MPLPIDSHEALAWLDGMADGNDTTPKFKELADLIRDLTSTIAKLVDAGQAVVDHSDDAGCDEDLTVTSKETIEALSGVVYTCRECKKLWNACECNSADGGYQSPREP